MTSERCKECNGNLSKNRVCVYCKLYNIKVPVITFEKNFPSLRSLPPEMVVYDKAKDTITIPMNIFTSCLVDEQRVKELDEIFYSVPQPCKLEERWETKKKELGVK